MSKEKQCECCHEWWYGSDVKEDLCPNCYYYFKQLKRQLKEKDNLIEFGKEEIRKRNKRIDEIVERDKKLFDDKNKELEKLKQQLEEKEKQIDIISRDNNSYKYNIDEQKRIIDDFAKQLKEKDNYHLRYELAGADETIANLRQQLAEKDKEIERLKIFLNSTMK